MEMVERTKEQFRGRNDLPAVCFTCGAWAHKIIYLPRGCAAMRTEGFVGICPQHEYTIEPLEPYTAIAAMPASSESK